MPEWLLIGMAGFYAAILFILSVRLIISRSHENHHQPFVSVLIAARNEAVTIGACLEALQRQDYPADRFEIIVADDRSSDGTGERVLRYQKNIPALRVLRVDEVPAGFAPKKFALQTGIQQAKGEIILCTDADCRPRRQWIRRMIASLDDSVGMVIGYSPIVPQNRLSLQEYFSALEGLALGALAWASTISGFPLTATGRSLAYRKEVFEAIGGFSGIAHFISGDDDLLMHKFRNAGWKIAYCHHPESQVETNPPSSWKQFIHQKIRHASKSRHYSLKIIAVLSAIYFFNTLLALSPFMAWLFPAGWKWVIYAWGIKISADGFFLLTAAWRFRRMNLMKWYPVVAVLHPYYVMIFGLMGWFARFEWKDQRFEKTAGKKE